MQGRPARRISNWTQVSLVLLFYAEGFSSFACGKIGNISDAISAKALPQASWHLGNAGPLGPLLVDWKETGRGIRGIAPMAYARSQYLSPTWCTAGLRCNIGNSMSDTAIHDIKPPGKGSLGANSANCCIIDLSNSSQLTSHNTQQITCKLVV